MTTLSNTLWQLFSLFLMACAPVSAAPIPKGGGNSSSGGGSTTHAGSSGTLSYVRSIGGSNHCYSDGTHKTEMPCPKTKLSWDAICGIVTGSGIGMIILIVFITCCIKKIRSRRKRTAVNNSYMPRAPSRPGFVPSSTPTSALLMVAEPVWTPDSTADKAASFAASIKDQIDHGSEGPKCASWVTTPPPYHPDTGHVYLNSGLPSCSAADRMPGDVRS